MTDVIELARELIAVRTPGEREQVLAALLAPRLARAGFDVEDVPLAEGRSSLIARFAGGGPLTLSGHLDVVPAVGEWDTDPYDAVVLGDRLVGRGASDMKAGVAAMVLAATAHAQTARRGFTLLLTAAEETGCLGAATVAPSLPDDSILVIGEATDNELRFGHKGCTWLTLDVRGRAAHASRPELGRNAIDELMTGLQAAHGHFPATVHDALGAATLNVGVVSGGSQPNIVPDHASARVDVRTVPGLDVGGYRAAVASAMPHGSVGVELALPAVWTDPAASRSRTMADLVGLVTGRTSQPAGTAYFTDAGRLPGGGGVYILGPGDPLAPHTANESCRIDRIHEAQRLYAAILTAWEDGRLD